MMQNINSMYQECRSWSSREQEIITSNLKPYLNPSPHPRSPALAPGIPPNTGNQNKKSKLQYLSDSQQTPKHKTRQQLIIYIIILHMYEFQNWCGIKILDRLISNLTQ